MEYHETRGITPWLWVLIAVAAIILVFVIWWVVTAQGPERIIVTAPEEEERPPAQPPAEQQPAEQPVVVERESPVNIYIERERPQPSVIVAPRGEQPPQARERLRQVDLPSRFRYQGKIWEPSNAAFREDDVNLKDSGASVDGNIVYVERDAGPPYDRLYLETEPGSQLYIRYIPKS